MTAATMSEHWSVDRVPARMPSKNVGWRTARRTAIDSSSSASGPSAVRMS